MKKMCAEFIVIKLPPIQNFTSILIHCSVLYSPCPQGLRGEKTRLKVRCRIIYETLESVNNLHRISSLQPRTQVSGLKPRASCLITNKPPSLSRKAASERRLGPE